MLELDVHLSQDGQVVVAHDQVPKFFFLLFHVLVFLQNLLRLTGEAVSIRERRLEDLPCLQSKVTCHLLWERVASILNASHFCLLGDHRLCTWQRIC